MSVAAAAIDKNSFMSPSNAHGYTRGALGKKSATLRRLFQSETRPSYSAGLADDTTLE